MRGRPLVGGIWRSRVLDWPAAAHAYHLQGFASITRHLPVLPAHQPAAGGIVLLLAPVFADVTRVAEPLGVPLAEVWLLSQFLAAYVTSVTIVGIAVASRLLFFLLAEVCLVYLVTSPLAVRSMCDEAKQASFLVQISGQGSLTMSCLVCRAWLRSHASRAFESQKGIGIARVLLIAVLAVGTGGVLWVFVRVLGRVYTPNLFLAPNAANVGIVFAFESVISAVLAL